MMHLISHRVIEHKTTVYKLEKHHPGLMKF